jgi:hypothetical protein
MSAATRKAALTLLLLPSHSSRMLSISSAHITERTAKLLDWQDVDVVDCPVDEPDGEGTQEPVWSLVSYSRWGTSAWIFVVNEDQITGATEVGCPELAQVLNLALEEGFDYLMIDADAQRLPSALGFQEFEW